MKKQLLLVLPLLGIALVLVSTAQQVDTCDERITTTPLDFVVTAFDNELDAVLSLVEVEYSCHVGDVIYHVGSHEGERLIVYMSGVGPKTATQTTEQTLQSFNVTMLVFSGIAGSVDRNLSVGDTVVVKTWYDLGGGEPITIADAYLQKAQQEGVEVVEGGITVDYFVTDTSTLPGHVSIVDMETHAIAVVAKQNSVPFIAFRSISDLADGTETSEGFTRAASNSADAALAFVAHN